MKNRAIYLQVLMNRYEYFKDKKAIDLKDDELKELINLRKEITETFPEVKEAVISLWEGIKEALNDYNDRVKKED